VKSACTYKQKFKKPCFGPEYSSDNSGDGPEKRVLWDVFQILRILSAHDWKIAIEIAVSHWDSRTAMDQLNLLDDVITDATEIGILEGSTVHCDECEVMRWINTGTHLPNPWFCPSCLYFKDATLYGTQLKPSPLGRTFLFDIVRSNETLMHAEIIMKTMAVWEEDDKSESDDSEYESEVQYLAYDFDEEVRRRVLAREKDEDVEEEVKKHAYVESEMVTQQSEEPCHSVAQSSLVEWPPIRGIAVEEVSMDVADIKPVKATLLEEHDIEWWLQQARCQKKVRKHKNGRRRNRRKATVVLLYQPARRKRWHLKKETEQARALTWTRAHGKEVRDPERCVERRVRGKMLKK
jgi:hypothetical protein